MLALQSRKNLRIEYQLRDLEAYATLAEHLNTANPAVVDLLQRAAESAAAKGGGDPLHGHAAALQLLWSLTWREAQTQTFADAFLAIMACFVIATLMVPLMRKAAPPKGPATDSH